LRLALDEPKATDSAFDQGDISYIIDSELVKRTGQIVIDYVDAGYQSGFSIQSANPVGGGGCSSGGSCSC
jgi:iron-sulfur cluster assembly protein